MLQDEMTKNKIENQKEISPSVFTESQLNQSLTVQQSTSKLNKTWSFKPITSN
jgi:hypothetical protein